MKTLLITPKAAKGWPSYCPPIGLCYLKSCLLKAGFSDVTVLDLGNKDFEDVRSIISSSSPDVVGITSFTETRHNALRTAEIVKEVNPRIITIMGGVHATLMYQQIMDNYNYVDIISLGESEITVVDLFHALKNGNDLSVVNGIVYKKNGKIIKTEKRDLIHNLDSIPFPNYDDLDLTAYKEGYEFGRGKPRASVMTSRGCQFSCIFCATHPVWGSWRPRTATNVVDEIEWLVKEHKFEIFSIADDLFTFNRKRIVDICNQIIERKLEIKWSAQTRTDCVTPEILTLMRKAGCQVLQFGVESGSPSILKNLNKRENLPDIRNAFKWAKAAGIKTQFNVIIGSPGETKDTIKETKKLIRETRPEYIGAGGLRVFPGTELWKRAVEEGIGDENFYLSNEECLYYTGSMEPNKMFGILAQMLLVHAMVSGPRALVALFRRGISTLIDTPRKFIAGILPWK